ncbi:MAG: OmpP1/FadL family transporter, partial [Limisphaerales bacterium]
MMQKKLTKAPAARANRYRYAFAIALTLASAESSHAVGFLLPNQDPEAIGRGDAFAATADDPAAIYYNPAGITQLPGIQASLGLYAISAYTRYFSSSTAETAHTDPRPQFVPQIYGVDTLKNLPISFGLGIYAPYGLGVDWGAEPANPQPEKGNLTYLTANPVVAWKICKMLSVAAGVTVNYANASFAESDGIGVFKFSGHDLEPGFNLGILFQPHPMWSFG